jgi:hypothetical protein
MAFVRRLLCHRGTRAYLSGYYGSCQREMGLHICSAHERKSCGGKSQFCRGEGKKRGALIISFCGLAHLLACVVGATVIGVVRV